MDWWIIPSGKLTFTVNRKRYTISDRHNTKLKYYNAKRLRLKCVPSMIKRTTFTDNGSLGFNLKKKKKKVLCVHFLAKYHLATAVE